MEMNWGGEGTAMGSDYGKTITKNLRRILYEKDITAAEMSRALGIRQTTISNWMNGVRTPRGDNLDMLCDFLHVSRSDLVEEHTEKKPMVIKVPVLGYVAAGIPIEMIEDVQDYEELDPETFDPAYQYFGLTIRGDSMTPKIDDGDIVIVRKQPDAESGQLVIVAVNGDNATCKRLRKHHDGIELVPANPHYQPVFYSNEDVRRLPVTILGVVVELRARFL